MKPLGIFALVLINLRNKINVIKALIITQMREWAFESIPTEYSSTMTRRRAYI